MKSLLLTILVLVSHPISFLKERNRLIFSRIASDRENDIQIRKTELKKGRICVRGRLNKLQISQANIYNTQIVVKGNNNSLIVESGVKLFNMRLEIRSSYNIVRIGKNTTFGGGNLISEGERNQIIIGEDCMIAEFVDIWNSDTHVIVSEKGAVLNPCAPIKIGNHVWIGKDVSVLKGVSIGDGSVIGMKSVVTKDVDAHSLYAGVPARRIKDGVDWKR